MQKLLAPLFFISLTILLSCQDASTDPNSPEFNLGPDDILFTFEDRVFDEGWIFLVDQDGNTTEAKEFLEGEKVTFLAGELPSPYPFDVFICQDTSRWSSSLFVYSFEDYFDPEDEFIIEDPDDHEVISTNWFEIETEKEIVKGRYNLYEDFSSYGAQAGDEITQFYDLYEGSDFAFFCHRYEDSDLYYYKDWNGLSPDDTLYMTESDFKAYDGSIDLSNELGYSLDIYGIKNDVKYWVDQGQMGDIVYYPTGVFDDLEVITEYEHPYWQYHSVISHSPELSKINVDDYQIVLNDTSDIQNFSIDAVNIDRMALTHSYDYEDGLEVSFVSFFDGTDAIFSFTHFPESIIDKFGTVEQLNESEVYRVNLYDDLNEDNSDEYLVLIRFFAKWDNTSSRHQNNNQEIFFPKFRLEKKGRTVKGIIQ